MTTKREQFTEWLRDFVAALNDSDDTKDYLLTRGERDEIADAAARIWEGPEIEVCETAGGGFFARRFVRVRRVEMLHEDGWQYASKSKVRIFDSRDEAEAALAKSKGTDQ